MKKILLIICAIFFLTPVLVQAEDVTEKMYTDIEVRADGSLFVRTLRSLSGTYNGQWSTIDYRRTYASPFTGAVEDFGESDIYDASGIRNLKVYDILDKDHLTFSSLNDLNHQFREVSTASVGDYGVYTREDTSTGINLQIYNPSSYNSAFYIEYEIVDAVVVHQDVAELNWRILGDEYQDNINDFVVQVHLPQKDSSMRVWAHGPLNGEIQRLHDDTALLTYDFLGAYNPVNVRIMFDKDLVPEAVKTTDIQAKDLILAYEEEQADIANQERSKIRFWNNTIIGITGAWYLGLIALLIYTYLKYDKERKVAFNAQYYRDFPGNYGPEVLEYLLKNRISEDGLSASILAIVQKKALKIEELNDQKKEYKFVKVDEYMNSLTKTEQMVVHLLVDEIGNGKDVTLKAIKQYTRTRSNAEHFYDQYQDWLVAAQMDAANQEFFVSMTAPRVIGVLVSIIGIVVFILNIYFETSIFLGYLSVPMTVLSLVYFVTFQKRTEKGALEYQQWMAFKRFLKDFGRMDEKTLPEVTLWDKYLVYATILGCADELEKQMKIKMEAMHMTEDSMTFGNYYMMHAIIHGNILHDVSGVVHQAVSSSRSSVANSQNSSGGGFGGGVSSGGGGFGGGGGMSGGRF